MKAKDDVNPHFAVPLEQVFELPFGYVTRRLVVAEIPHKIFLYEEQIACKIHEGGYAAIWVGLDWIRQELTVEISPVVKDVTHIALE